MRLFMVRHGQSTANLAKTYAGQSDAPLTEQGRQEAMQIRPILENIPFDKVYSSDLIRAIDTQKLALPGKEGIRLPVLREIDVGSVEGMYIPQVQAEHGEKFRQGLAYACFGGESTQDTRDRASAFLRLLEEDPCENVIAFSHNGYISSLLEVVLKTPVDRAAVRSANCAIHVFDFDGRIWRLTAWNYMKAL